jgi:hypothetical protein
MSGPRFYIIQYMKFTAFAALLSAIVVGQPSASKALAVGTLILVGLSPVFRPVLPNSPESVLLKLPDDLDGSIAALERVVTACFKAGRSQEAIEWAEFLLQNRLARSERYFLHQTAGKAYASLGRTGDERSHKERAHALALEANDMEWIVESRAALAEFERHPGSLETAEALRPEPVVGYSI